MNMFETCCDFLVVVYFILASYNYSLLYGLILLLPGRVRLLMKKGHSCYRPRRDGERKRKSVRGCIVDANLSVLALKIVKKGSEVSCT